MFVIDNCCIQLGHFLVLDTINFESDLQTMECGKFNRNLGQGARLYNLFDENAPECSAISANQWIQVEELS